MRISKEPQVRRQEIIDTAMRLFARKGYEATTVSDIAQEMHVVPGLFYRYFESKQALYQTAVAAYAQEFAAPLAQLMDAPGLPLGALLDLLAGQLAAGAGREKYHDFFHRAGNQPFHRQLEAQIVEILLPHLERLLERLRQAGEINVDDAHSTALFLLHGQMPIINDETVPAQERVRRVTALVKKVLL